MQFVTDRETFMDFNTFNIIYSIIKAIFETTTDSIHCTYYPFVTEFEIIIQQADWILKNRVSMRLCIMLTIASSCASIFCTKVPNLIAIIHMQLRIQLRIMLTLHRISIAALLVSLQLSIYRQIHYIQHNIKKQQRRDSRI